MGGLARATYPICRRECRLVCVGLRPPDCVEISALEPTNSLGLRLRSVLDVRVVRKHYFLRAVRVAQEFPSHRRSREYPRAHDRILMMQSAQDRFREHERGCHQSMGGIRILPRNSQACAPFPQREISIATGTPSSPQDCTQANASPRHSASSIATNKHVSSSSG